MVIGILLPEGAPVPPGYGVTWRDSYGMHMLCHPMPFNMVIRAFIHWKYTIMAGCFKSKYEKELVSARMEGMADMRNHMSDTIAEFVEHKRRSAEYEA